MMTRENGPGAIFDGSGYYPTTAPAIDESRANWTRLDTCPNGTEQSPRLSARKIALIHVAKRQLGMADDAYRALLRSAAGAESSVALSASGFQAVMRRFVELGFDGGTGRAPQCERRVDMASPAQLRRVRLMFAAWMGRDDPAALRRWMSARYGVSDPRFATIVVAQKAIEGLKAMLERREARERAAAVQAAHDKGGRP